MLYTAYQDLIYCEHFLEPKYAYSIGGIGYKRVQCCRISLYSAGNSAHLSEIAVRRSVELGQQVGGNFVLVEELRIVMKIGAHESLFF